MIEAEIAAALTPVVDGRAYPVILPQGPDYPAITFHRLKTGQRTQPVGVDEIRGRAAQGLASLFQIVTWSRSYLSGIQIFRKTKQALEGIGLGLESAADGFEPSEGLYTVVQEYLYYGDLNRERGAVPVSPPIVAGLVSGVLSAVSAQFADRVPTVRWYEPVSLLPEVPAVFVDVTAMRLGETRGDGTTAIDCDLRAYAILSRAAGDVAARDFAAELCALIEYNQFGQGRGASVPAGITAGPAVYTPTGAGIIAWSVEWRQTVFFDNRPADPPCFLPPDTVYTGTNPEGPGDYGPAVEGNRPA